MRRHSFAAGFRGEPLDARRAPRISFRVVYCRQHLRRPPMAPRTALPLLALSLASGSAVATPPPSFRGLGQIAGHDTLRCTCMAPDGSVMGINTLDWNSGYGIFVPAAYI